MDSRCALVAPQESRRRGMVYGLRFMVCGLWYMVYGLWFMVYGLCFIVDGLLFMVYCLREVRRRQLLHVLGLESSDAKIYGPHIRILEVDTPEG